MKYTFEEFVQKISEVNPEALTALGDVYESKKGWHPFNVLKNRNPPFLGTELSFFNWINYQLYWKETPQGWVYWDSVARTNGV